MDKRAIAIGVSTQLLTFTVLLFTTPLEWTVTSFMIGGLVTGWRTTSFRTEYIDGAITTTIGLGGSVLIIIASNWLALTGLSFDRQLSYTLITFLHTLGFAIPLLAVAGLTGAITSQSVVICERHYQRLFT